MDRDVICVSRTLAAGAEEIGAAIAEKLSLEYVDREIIVAAAEKAGVSSEAMEAVEHTPGLIARILESLARVPSTPDTYAVWPAELPPSYEHLIRHIVREVADRGKVVILAHGASFELADSKRVLRVLVTAPAAVRAGRLARGGDVSAGDAEKAIEDSDRQRRYFLRRFYDIPEELPSHYDVVLNTERLSRETAAQVIVDAVGGP